MARSWGNGGHQEEGNSVSLNLGADDRETKKVKFKEGDGDRDVEMIEDLDSHSKISWKQMLLGKRACKQGERLQFARNDSAYEFDFLEGDVKKTMVNGIPTIELLEYIQQILFKDMKTTVVLKLFGQNIGYA
ncbi:hypothetical protein J1N35_018778 [Gossypium stocksii]|uniref:Uncharacterized protein n=1 Tax=Gossypium stocksii TaxID=47602 RepID=A0A9D3VPQ8_9ROSI|nr:hypothetical protein J1N35_018778 [Gossypium stocksii]